MSVRGSYPHFTEAGGRRSSNGRQGVLLVLCGAVRCAAGAGTEHPPPSHEPARSSRQLEQLAQLGVGGTRSSPSAGGSRRRAAGAVLLSCNTRCMSHQVSMCWSQAIRASGFSMFFRRWQPSLSKGSTSRSRSSLPSCGSLPGAAATSAEGSGSSSGSGPSATLGAHPERRGRALVPSHGAPVARLGRPRLAAIAERPTRLSRRDQPSVSSISPNYF